jgi:hypothetical protein
VSAGGKAPGKAAEKSLVKKAEFRSNYARFSTQARRLEPCQKMRGGFRLYALIVFA